jgi:ferredoxin-NADP reductase
VTRVAPNDRWGRLFGRLARAAIRRPRSVVVLALLLATAAAAVAATRLDLRTRITDLIQNGRIFADLGIAPLNPAEDRVMICGSMAMLQDTKRIVEELGFTEGSNASPGDFVVEKAFVD